MQKPISRVTQLSIPRPFLWDALGLALVLVSVGLLPVASSAQSTGGCAADPSCGVLADFEEYEEGGLPLQWYTYENRKHVQRVNGDLQNDEERFIVVRQGANQFIRALVYDRAHRIILRNGENMDWDIRANPVLKWDWRAQELPLGAREDRSKLNDSGAAVYVLFDKDWLGRPRGIKYSYSSTLPAGSTASYGTLRVLVVSSGPEDGIGNWITHERDVAADYEALFGKRPRGQPSAIFLWSDSDSVNGSAVADFDNLEVTARRGD